MRIAVCFGLSFLATSLCCAKGRTVVRGDSANYWASNSVVVIRVLEAHYSPQIDYIVAEVVGTLSGPLDPAAHRHLLLPWPNSRAIQTRLPAVEDMLLVDLDDSKPKDNPLGDGDDAYSISTYKLPFIPAEDGGVAVLGEQLSAVLGSSLTTIQMLRHDVPVESGSTDAYWQRHSVIFAEVWFMEWASRGNRQQHMVVFPLATLSGDFDAGSPPGPSEPGSPPPKEPVSSELSPRAWTALVVDWNLPMRGEFVKPLPKGGDKVLLVLRKDEQTGQYVSVESRSAFMPGEHYSSRIVKDFSDSDVEATLKAVQELQRGTTKVPRAR